jgi:hypothetical protein
MALVTRTLLALQMGHHDLTNRVCVGPLCPRTSIVLD